MKQVENGQLLLRLATLVVVVVLITMVEPMTSQPTDRNTTVMGYVCSEYKRINEEYFLSNLNTTLTSLRRQLTTNGYATAHTSFNGEPVWGLASCRGYLSIPGCLDCFDYAVEQVKLCGPANGATAIYSDCDVRYENINFFTERNQRLHVLVCDNITSSQPKEFRKAAKKLLRDLTAAAPRTSNFYAASTRQEGDGNATAYAIAQCNLNVSQSVCLECLKLGSLDLDECFPAITGRAIDIACFIRLKKIGRHQQGAPAGAGYYSHKQLQLATKNFSEENIIGKGGFGEAVLDDNKVVAVKKLKVGYIGAKVGFENEILLISRIRHRNLLRLLGSSEVTDALLLVLEYMPNGSLDRFLWGAKRGTLNWKQRYDIILGIARGLAHLHKEFHVKIVHRDIKSSNILLDDDFQPKIADFGLARFQPEDKSHVITKCVGTLGYTAPEYVLYGSLSDKVDTFSFGIVTLEIISGRRCAYRNFDGPSTDCLLEHAWKLYENKNHIKLVDDTLDANEYEDENVMKIIEIALLCTQSPVSKRPTMAEVFVILLNDQSLGDRQPSRSNFSSLI
ncbi:cysteine-rich receptor-like protein kinase 2 [Tanacetum coccineum]